ncbi:DUF2059 domain-containing protein [Flavisphingomonas formosensis]|uniref:DUF2059 domain-containing protein n=1 Tax=Flavisphingomonas formosensis TaxID=861534 RepID=UPI0012F9F4BB|nr:DUF2059 domain-containing protein [Sphingomonas formosensis]
MLIFTAEDARSATPAAPPPAALPIVAPSLRVSDSDPLVTVAVDCLLPKDRLEGQLISNFDKGFYDSFDKDPQAVELERQYPGTRAAALEAGRAAAKTVLLQAFADLRTIYVRMLTDTFLRQEFVQLDAFLQSPVGRKMVNLGEKAVDPNKLIDEARSSPNGLSVTQQSISRAMNPLFLDNMTDDEIKALGRFALTPPGRKFYALTPRVKRELADWMSGLLNGSMGDIQVAVARAVADHIRNLKAAN